MLQVFYLDVIYVFAMAFHVFSGVFVIVLDACFKCFIYLDMYVTNILCGCFKSRSSVTHITMAPVPGGQLSAAGLRLLSCVARLALSSPLLSLPSLLFPPSRLAVGVGVGVGSSRVLCLDAYAGVDGMQYGAGAGAASGRVLQRDVRASAPLKNT
jgi:hypothetical protein